MNAESETVQAELIIHGEPEEALPLWEAKLPGSGMMAGSSKRLLGLTASTGGIAQAVSSTPRLLINWVLKSRLHIIHSMRLLVLISGIFHANLKRMRSSVMLW
jgi:hypothetical protein